MLRHPEGNKFDNPLSLVADLSIILDAHRVGNLLLALSVQLKISYCITS
jgi:hypothetical protein